MTHFSKKPLQFVDDRRYLSLNGEAVPVRRVDTELIPKAYIENIATGERSYVLMIWQEGWASWGGKFIEGRIVYHSVFREWDTPPLYSREYHIAGSKPIVLREDAESCGFGCPFDELGKVCVKAMIQGDQNWKKAAA